MKRVTIPKGWKKITRGKIRKGDKVLSGPADPMPPKFYSASVQEMVGIDAIHSYCCIRRK